MELTLSARCLLRPLTVRRSVWAITVGVVLVFRCGAAVSLAQERAILPGHNGVLYSVSISADGKRVATSSGGPGDCVKVWDMATAKATAALSDFRIGVACVAFSPDGKTLATTGFKEPARLYDTATWKVRHRLDGCKEGTRHLAFSPDGKLLTTAEFSDAVHLWDPTTGKDLGSFPAGIQGLIALVFSPDGKLLAGSGFGKVFLWDVASRKQKASLEGHKNVVKCLAFAPDGKTLVSVEVGLLERNVFLWDVASGKRTGKVVVDDVMSEAYAAAFAPDGKALAVVGFGRVLLWDVTARRSWTILKTYDKIVTYWAESVAFSPDGRTLVVGCTNGTARLWDVPKKK